MLRETRARLLTALTALFVIVLAAMFSFLSNPPGSTALGPAASMALPDVPGADAGRRAYDRMGCAGCHSIAGQGHPGSPLDGVGDRFDAATIEAWVVGRDPVRARLPGSIARMKSRYAADPDLGAVVEYLQTLRVASTDREPPASK